MFIQAIDPFINYQQVINPPPVSSTQPTYFRFGIGDVSFFVLDSLSWSSAQPARPEANSTAGFGNRTMLGESQFMAIKEWAEEGTRDGKLLVLVSGVPITRNWSEGEDKMDSWGASVHFSHFPQECKSLIEAVGLSWRTWGNSWNVVVVRRSRHHLRPGDRHEHGKLSVPLSLGFPLTFPMH